MRHPLLVPLPFIVLGVVISALSMTVEPTAQQIAACRDDVLRLCAAAASDMKQIQACIIRHISDLSPRCREALK